MSNQIIEPLIDISTPLVGENVEDLIQEVIAELTAVASDLVSGQVGIKISNDEEVQLLNLQFRGKDRPTNVLSFPYEPNELERKALEAVQAKTYLGDIIISADTVQREAQEQNKSLKEHFQHLVVHGILHLHGYNHIDEADALVMEDLEIQILAKLGIPNPY